MTPVAFCKWIEIGGRAAPLVLGGLIFILDLPIRQLKVPFNQHLEVSGMNSTFVLKFEYNSHEQRHKILEGDAHVMGSWSWVRQELLNSAGSRLDHFAT